MSSINPNGTVWLIKDVPFSPNYFHEIVDFDDSKNQKDYMTKKSRVVLQLDSQNYVKTEIGKIKVQANADKVEDVTYMAWDNADIDGAPAKMVYAFVTNIDLISANVVEISYEVDVFQTYVVTGRVSFLQCLIERRTPKSDTIGIHLEPEPLTPGEKVLRHKEEFNEINPDYSKYRILMWSTFSTDANSLANALDSGLHGMGRRAGIYQGLYCTVFQNEAAFESFMTMTQGWDDDESTYVMNNIVAIVAVPSRFALPSLPDNNWSPITPYNEESNYSVSHTFTKQLTELDTYGATEDNKTTIKYNKLKTYPYNGFYITNNDGEGRDFRYEYMKSSKFKAIAAVQPNFEIIVVPESYDYFGDTDQEGEVLTNLNGDYAISLTGFPQIPWMSSAYKQWLASSQMGYEMQGIGTIASGVISALSGNAVGVGMAALGLAHLQGNYLTQEHGAKIAANPTHQGGSSAKTVGGLKTVVGYQRCINRYEAERFDDYFSRFGYAINQIQTPTLDIPTGRNQCYMKTAGCLIKGDCPSEYLRKIENIFDKGVTMWKESKLGTYN